jgi:protein-S-isoprenylcysteine O-methyltransferase Ste14
VIGVLDWDSLGYDHWSRFAIGVPLIGFGFFFGLWAVRALGAHQSLGLRGTLLTTGPYRRTRNPQYVSDVLLFVGAILITNSLMALLTGIVAILWFLLAPLSEEPWLRDQFGAPYEEYCKEVPRFLGKNSFRRRPSS